jgi:hypothetical protein
MVGDMMDEMLTGTGKIPSQTPQVLIRARIHRVSGAIQLPLLNAMHPDFRCLLRPSFDPPPPPPLTPPPVYLLMSGCMRYCSCSMVTRHPARCSRSNNDCERAAATAAAWEMTVGGSCCGSPTRTTWGWEGWDGLGWIMIQGKTKGHNVSIVNTRVPPQG